VRNGDAGSTSPSAYFSMLGHGHATQIGDACINPIRNQTKTMILSASEECLYIGAQLPAARGRLQQWLFEDYKCG
jgi:carboxylesterase type B